MTCGPRWSADGLGSITRPLSPQQTVPRGPRRSHLPQIPAAEAPGWPRSRPRLRTTASRLRSPPRHRLPAPALRRAPPPPSTGSPPPPPPEDVPRRRCFFSAALDRAPSTTTVVAMEVDGAAGFIRRPTRATEWPRAIFSDHGAVEEASADEDASRCTSPSFLRASTPPLLAADAFDFAALSASSLLQHTAAVEDDGVIRRPTRVSDGSRDIFLDLPLFISTASIRPRAAAIATAVCGICSPWKTIAPLASARPPFVRGFCSGDYVLFSDEKGIPLERENMRRLSSSLPHKDLGRYLGSDFPYWVVPCHVNLIGEADTMPPVVMLRESGKLLGHSLLQDLNNLHMSGYCLFNPLGDDDVMVDSDGRMKIKEGTLVVEVRMDYVRRFDRDWDGASVFLEEMFTRCLRKAQIKLPLPPDLQHVFKIMKIPLIPKSLLAVLHPCWMPLQSRGQATMDANDYTLYAMSEEKAKSIRNGLSHQDEWPSILQGNWLLQKWFKRSRKKDGSFKKIKNGKVFLLHQRILRAHSLEYRRETEYTKDELEFLLHVKTPMLLPELYARMWSKKVDLKFGLPIERYFSYTSRDGIFFCCTHGKTNPDGIFVCPLHWRTCLRKR
ncbi:hypothetical protein ACP4OV_022588 [Aristida adscensionis]